LTIDTVTRQFTDRLATTELSQRRSAEDAGELENV
jgi:hypothetical protein